MVDSLEEKQAATGVDRSDAGSRAGVKGKGWDGSGRSSTGRARR